MQVTLHSKRDPCSVAKDISYHCGNSLSFFIAVAVEENKAVSSVSG